MSDIYLSVVIPCYNEEKNIRLGALESVSHFLKKQKYEFEVILVDDGSTDESVSLIKKFVKEHQNFRYHLLDHRGKSAAVTKGVFLAKGEYVLFSDLDQATPINQIKVLFPWFNKGYDIIIGSRAEQRKGAPILRLLMARVFMLLRNIILDLGIKDTQCGFKAFRKSAARDIFSKLKVFTPQRRVFGSTVTAGFDVELLYIAKKLGYKIKEVPVEWHYQETRHINPLKDSLESIIDLVKIKLNSISNKY